MKIAASVPALDDRNPECVRAIYLQLPKVVAVRVEAHVDHALPSLCR
jgi:hypothetical protein